MAQIFGEFLGYREIGIGDNFYELGGDSIIAAKMINTVNQRMGLNVAVEELLKHPTIEELAKILNKRQIPKTGDTGKYPLEPGSPREEGATAGFLSINPMEKKEYYPTSEFQEALHIYSQIRGSKGVGVAYNLPLALLVEGKVDKQRLEQVFQGLTERHETLRTWFEEVKKQSVQRIHHHPAFKLDYIQVENEINQDIDALIKDFVKPFDLEKAPLLRVRLVKLEREAEKYLLLIDIHHIISDGQSGMILMKDFMDLYRNQPLEPLPVQFKDFIQPRLDAGGAVIAKKQEAYWLDVFKEGVPELDMPLDRPRPWMQSFKGDNVYVGNSEGLKERLNELASTTQTTLFMVLLAAFNVLLFKYTGNQTIVTGVPSAGRRFPGMKPLIGSFVNTLPLKNHPGKSKTFTQLLAEVKLNSIKAFENQDYPFGRLVRKLGVQKQLGRNPVYDVMFVFQNQENLETGLDIEGLKFKPYRVLRNNTDVDLVLDVNEKHRQLFFRWRYCTRIYNRESIETMAANYIKILETIIRDKDILIQNIDVQSPN
jgi:acyl carrier protein